MKRRDAIDLLDNLVGMVDDNQGSDYDAALKMGIQALQTEQLKESPENFNKDSETESMLNADLISRQAVDEYISQLLSDYLYDEERERLEQFSAWLWDELPSVQSEQKVGKWIYEPRRRMIGETDNGAVYMEEMWCKCSECGADFGYIKNKDKYCKFCGAKME